MYDPRLREFATPTELKYLDVLERVNSQRAVARELGCSKATVDEAMNRLKKRAALKGYSPDHDMNRTVPDGFKVKGVSTYYNADGKPSGQWVKSSADAERQEAMLREYVTALASEIKGLSPIVKAPQHTADDLLCVYPMGDPHFGMLAWWEDAGENFDLDEAERLTKSAVDRLVASAPPAKTAILLNLGDMFHSDNQTNRTNSGNQLDVDGRWAKAQKVGLFAMIHCMQRLLERHEKVIFRINRGNHDGHSSYALALMLSCWFHNNKRVQVDLSPATAWYYSFGKNLIGSTHGDTLKGNDLMSIMADDKPEEWGKTKHRYWYVGHVHHHDSKEYRGGIVEYFRTLAAKDAWHAGQGYRSGRDMRLIVIHKEHGEIERHRCDVGML
jgi:DNA-binding Lrp family transcriptional regulator